MGPSAQQGYFASGYYYNPKHRMRFKLPKGWSVTGYDKYVYLYNKNDNAYILLYSYSNSPHDPFDRHFLEKKWGMTITSNIRSANFSTGYLASKTTQQSKGNKLTVYFVALINKYDLALLKHQYYKESNVHPDLKYISKSVSLYKREASIQRSKKGIKIIKVTPETTIDDLARDYDMDVQYFKLINSIDFPSDYRSRQFVKVIE